MSRRLGLLTVNAVLLCCGAALRSANAQNTYVPMKSRIDRLVQPLLDGEIVAGLSIGLVDGNNTYILGYGVASTRNERPDGDTVYEIGSITKVFTGTLLSDMLARQEVKLNAPVASCLPDTVTLPKFGDVPITLLDLATQSSGLPRMPDNLAPKSLDNPYADYTPAKMLAFLAGYRLRRMPGQRYEYSNLGVGLLGYALAQKAGASYEELVKSRICEPLGMNDTVITLTPELRSRLADGHDSDLDPVPTWDLNALVGAGAIKSTVNDMARFLKANMGLTPTPLQDILLFAQKPQRPISGPGQIGLNWHIRPDGRVIWHNGQTGGYHALIAFNPTRRQGVVVLCNTNNGVVDDLGFALLSVLAGDYSEPLKIRLPVHIDTAIYDQYVGEYRSGPTSVITILRDGDRLKAKISGEVAYRLYPASETEFFYRVADAQIKFIKNEQGKVERLVLHQNGRDIPARKVK